MKQLDYINIDEELRALASGQRELAKKYLRIRNNYGQAKWELMLLLVPHLKDDRYRKASSAKQVLMLLSDTLEVHKVEVYGIAEKYTKTLESFKGLQRLIDANASRISTIQSLMRYASQNGG